MNTPLDETHSHMPASRCGVDATGNDSSNRGRPPAGKNIGAGCIIHATAHGKQAAAGEFPGHY
jgi:hypothetical protein